MPCLCCFQYSMDFYDERKIFPLEKPIDATGKTQAELQECEHRGCTQPAYFICNRNLCSETSSCKNPKEASEDDQERHFIRKNKLHLWDGCGKSFCWQHFKFEHFIDRDNFAEEKVIVNWHCTEGNCSKKRELKNCGAFLAIISPILVLFITLAIFNMESIRRE